MTNALSVVSVTRDWQVPNFSSEMAAAFVLIVSEQLLQSVMEKYLVMHAD